MDYLCSTWQGYVQMVVFLVGRGYGEYSVVSYPARKVDLWRRIDAKIVKKYDTDKSKFQRARLRQKGFANFYFLRWEDQAIILRTGGKVADGIIPDDRFYAVRDNKPISVRVSDNIEILVFVDDTGKVSVRLASECYKGFKAVLWDMAMRGKYRLVAEFDRLNGIPAWSGVIKQKRELARYAVRQGRKHGMKIVLADLRVNTRRVPVKVFD